MAVLNTRWRVLRRSIFKEIFFRLPRMTELQLAWQPTLVRLGSPPFHSFCTLQQDEEKINQNFQFPLHYNINNYIPRHVGDERKWCRSFQRITVHPGAHSQGGGKRMPFDCYGNQQCVPRRWFALHFKIHFTAFTHRTMAWGWWLNTLLRVSQLFRMHLFTPGEYQLSRFD